MSDTLQGVIIGGAFGVVGVLLGFVANLWLENQKARREHIRNARLRLVGERIQTSEVMDLIKLQRKRKWPRFWKLTSPDMSGANMQEVDLRGQNLRGVKFFRANFDGADLIGADLSRLT